MIRVDKLKELLAKDSINQEEYDDKNTKLEKKYYKKINNKIPARDQFIKDVKKNIKYSQKNRSLCHYFLHEIERIQFKNNNIKPATATVEHIVPRSPAKWKLRAKDVTLLHHIGNLIFLEKDLNESIQNKDYNHELKNGFKKSSYKQISEGFLKNGVPIYDFEKISQEK